MKQTITGWLSAAPRKLQQLSQPDLYRIDIEQVARELNLEGEARKLADAGLPLPEQAGLTAPESKAVQRVEKARQDFVRWGFSRVNVLNEDLARRDVAVLVNEALVADKAFERKAASTFAAHEQLFHDLAENAAVRQRELDDFRARNELTRAATYPEGSATFARYAVLLALIVVEGVANAYFFSQGLESGLIGGFLAAGLFAAVNLVTAFVLGKFAVPFVFHRHTALKAVGLAACAFALVWMITVGLTIAQFRDALVMDTAEPARAAWAAIKVSPFALRDIMSWLLFAISMLFAVFALFDGLSSEDRYPGYGAVARRARQSRDDYLGELHAIRREIEDHKDEAIGEIEAHIQQARVLVAEATGLIREKNWARTRMETALLDAENCLDTVLKVFRDTNRVHRGASPPPGYFETRPSMQQLAVPDFGPERDKASLREQERLLESLLAGADDVRARIETSYQGLTEKLKPVPGIGRPA